METLFQTDNGVQIVRLTSPQEVDGLLTTFEAISDELSWQPEGQIRASQAAAEHLAVLVGGTLAGGLQAVPGFRVPTLPYRRVWPDIAVIDPEQTIHVTIMALCPKFRGRSSLFWPLCVELWRYCIGHGLRTILLEVTPSMLRLYRRIGWPLEIIGELRMHWGEECYLCRMGVQEAADALTERAGHSASYRQLVRQGRRCPPAQQPLKNSH